MANFTPIRLSTDRIKGKFYQAIHNPEQPKSSLIVSSQVEVFRSDWESLRGQGFKPHPDYIEETNNGLVIISPTTLLGWTPDSLSRFLAKELPPNTLSVHFQELKKFIATYVKLPDPACLNLVSVLVLVSYWIDLFVAVAIIEILGFVGSGKTTLMRVLSCLCRSSLFCSISTIAGMGRARHLDPCTLFIDEPLHSANHPVVLGSCKKGSTRLLAGPKQELLRQNVYGLTFKVQDVASVPLADRTIYIHTTPSKSSLPPFYPEDHKEEIRHLTDNSLWISLYHFQEVLEHYEAFFRESSLRGRAAEKWAPIIAVANCIDASASKKEAITPQLERYMLEQVQAQSSELRATDLSLGVLSATQAYLRSNGHPHDNPEAVVVAQELTGFVSKYAGTEVTIQSVGGRLRMHGVLLQTRRSRRTDDCVSPSVHEHPKTLFEIDVRRLRDACEAYGLTEGNDK